MNLQRNSSQIMEKSKFVTPWWRCWKFKWRRDAEFALSNSYTSCSIGVQVMREQGAGLEFKVWGLGDKVWRLGDVKEEQPPTCSVELDPPQKEELEKAKEELGDSLWGCWHEGGAVSDLGRAQWSRARSTIQGGTFKLKRRWTIQGGTWGKVNHLTRVRTSLWEEQACLEEHLTVCEERERTVETTTSPNLSSQPRLENWKKVTPVVIYFYSLVRASETSKPIGCEGRCQQRRSQFWSDTLHLKSRWQCDIY